MSVLTLCLEILFSLLMLGILVVFIGSLLVSWSWAQNERSRKLNVVDVLATASVEWGAFVSLLACHFFRPKTFHEAPPAHSADTAPQQLPIIFVPSLHSGSAVFNFLIWRLKKNFWNSLWPFEWKSFLNNPEFLEDQLRTYIDGVVQKTQAKRFRIISFGSSRPIVSRTLDRENLEAYCDKWISISGPQQLGLALNFFYTARLKNSFAIADVQSKRPDLQIIGENDTLCYPAEVWGDSRTTVLPYVGHYGSVLHSITTKSVMKELTVS